MSKYLLTGAGAGALAYLGYNYRGEIEREFLAVEDALFVEHVAKYGKSYQTKEEFSFRQGLYQ